MAARVRWGREAEVLVFLLASASVTTLALSAASFSGLLKVYENAYDHRARWSGALGTLMVLFLCFLIFSVFLCLAVHVVLAIYVCGLVLIRSGDFSLATRVIGFIPILVMIVGIIGWRRFVRG